MSIFFYLTIKRSVNEDSFITYSLCGTLRGNLLQNLKLKQTLFGRVLPIWEMLWSKNLEAKSFFWFFQGMKWVFRYLKYSVWSCVVAVLYNQWGTHVQRVLHCAKLLHHIFRGTSCTSRATTRIHVVVKKVLPCLMLLAALYLVIPLIMLPTFIYTLGITNVLCSVDHIHEDIFGSIQGNRTSGVPYNKM